MRINKTKAAVILAKHLKIPVAELDFSPNPWTMTHAMSQEELNTLFQDLKANASEDIPGSQSIDVDVDFKDEDSA